MPGRPDKIVYFTKEDKLEFLNIISKYKDHFEKNDFTELNVKTKKDFWKLIEKEYNDISPKTGPRSAEQLQCLYKNLKRKARNDAIKEIGRTVQCSMDENTDSNENQPEDNEMQYIFLKPTLRSSSCVSEAAESSTTITLTDSNEEFVVQPLVTLESIQNSVSSNNCRQHEAIIKQKNEPVSSTKRSNDEQYLLKIKMLKFELETKKKEASLNYEIGLLRKEVEWKNKETAALEKKAKLEKINNQRILMKLQQENEILRNKILKIELAKAQESLTNTQSNINGNLPNEEVSLDVQNN